MHDLTLTTDKAYGALHATCSCGNWRYTGDLNETRKLRRLHAKHVKAASR